jgi:hypothetical protein
MNKLYCFAFFIFSLIAPSKTAASHLAGGEMTYTYLGSNEFLITATIYRDCRGLDLNSMQFGAYGGVNGSNGCFNTSLTFTRISIADITPRCSTQNAPCQPQNTGYTGEGLERHIYTCTVDISKTPFVENIAKSTCCEISFYAKTNSRSSSITTGPAGATFAIRLTINFCNLKKCAIKTSSSPRFIHPAIGYGCCNQSLNENVGGNDPDWDLVRYKIIPALYDLPYSPVNYSSPYTYQYPAHCYCVPPTTIKCVPNIKTSPPRGFYFDTSYGQLIYTPTKCDEVALIAVEATEYRKDTSGKLLPIASTIRDFILTIKDDCGYNKTPYFESANELYTVREGDTLSFDFDLKDVTFSPYQTIPDTPLIIKWDSIKGQSLQLLNPKDREKTYRFKWITKVGDAREVDYLPRFQGTDQSCPKLAFAYSSIRIRIQKKGNSLDFTQTPEVCGGLRLNAVTKPDDVPQFLWKVIDTSTGIQVATSSVRNWVPPPQLKGSYKVILTASQGFYFYDDVEKYVTLPGDYFHANIGKDTSLCQHNSLTIEPDIFNAVLPVKYEWTVLESNVVKYKDSGEQIDLLNLQKSKQILLTITDSLGCVFTTPLKTVNVLPIPYFNLGNDTTLCSKSAHTLGFPPDTMLRYSWNTGDTTSYIVAQQSGAYSLTTTTLNGCSFSDTIQIKLVPKPFIETQTDINICRPNSGEQEIDLNQYVRFNNGAVPDDTVKYASMTYLQTSNPIINKHYFKVNSSTKTGNWTVDYLVPKNSGCPPTVGKFYIYISPTPEVEFSITPDLQFVFDEFDIRFKNLSSISDNSKLRHTWNFDRFPGDTSNFAMDTTIVYPHASSGYRPTLVVRSEKGCVDSTYKLLNIIAGVDDVTNRKIIVSPDLVVLNKDVTDVRLMLFDGTGRLVTEIKNNLGLAANGANNPPPGVYFYSLEIIHNATDHQLLRGKILLPTQP